MTPYYQDDAVTIYHGDCRVIVPTLGKFDLLLTDPPYGIGEAAGNNKSRSTKFAKANDFGNSGWDDEPISNKLLFDCISAAKNAIVFGGNYYPVPPSPCWIVWDKDNGANDFADCELAWTNFDRAVRKFKWRWHGMLQEKTGTLKETRQHPTQKPVPLMRWCMRFAPDAVTILDPFAGSGTTGRAAKDLGRKATLIEREEKYCEIAAKRMAQEMLFS